MSIKQNLLSVIVPAFNEADSIIATLTTVFEVPPFKEVIIVNDGSTDNTGELIDHLAKNIGIQKPAMLKELKIIHKKHNEGKGAAIRSALEVVSGDIVLIQDADLEVNPYEYPVLLEPFEKLNADIVFGSRFRREGIMRVHRTIHFLGNKLLTWFSNFFTGLYLTDMETCYKVFKTEVVKSFQIETNRFGIDPELTAKVSQLVKMKGLNFYEVPISYSPRTYAQGKKIGFKDGFVVLSAIVYFNLFNKLK